MTVSMNKNRYNYKTPILINYDGAEYKYRLAKSVLQKRSATARANPNTPNEDLKIPYDFIIAILKYIVIHFESKKYIEDRGKHKEAFFVAKSKKKDIAVGVLVEMRDFLLTVKNVAEVPKEDYDTKTIKNCIDKECVYLSDLDLDKYVKKNNKRKKEIRKRLEEKAKKMTLFYASDTLAYRFGFSRHIGESRSSAKGARLTIPEAAVANILKHLVKNFHSKLEEKLDGLKGEKQLAIVFPSRDKRYHIGILVAIDNRLRDILLFNVITMIDIVPKDISSASFLFPKAERIFLPDYDLQSFMIEYEEEEKEKEKEKAIRKKEKVKRLLEENRANPNSITKVSRYSKQEPIIEKANVRRQKKIKTVRKVRVNNTLNAVDQRREDKKINNNKSLLQRVLDYVKSLLVKIS